jgi:nicotinic acid mononucleotide adenylyltransferase
VSHYSLLTHVTRIAIEISSQVFRKTARLLLAEERRWSALSSSNLFGISCTAALASTEAKKGSHRCYIGVTSRDLHRVVSVELEKGARDRVGEDMVCSRLIVEAAARVIPSHGAGADFINRVLARVPAEVQLTPAEKVEVNDVRIDVLDGVLDKTYSSAIFIEESPSFAALPDISLPANTFVYSGSFNPLHVGHTQLVAAAVKAASSRHSLDSLTPPLVLFEMSAFNADKPPLEKDQLENRIKQFSKSQEAIAAAGLSNFAVAVSSAPLFVDKASVFPNSIFIIGADTLTRILNPKYYGNSVEQMLCSLSQIRSQGCRFVVGGRVGPQGFIGAESILASEGSMLPPDLRNMFVGVTEEEFRVDLSSTEIRAREMEWRK